MPVHLFGLPADLGPILALAKKLNLLVKIYYPLGIHLQSAFAHLGYREGQLPESEKASREVLSLPVFPELTDAQQDLVVNGIAAFYRVGH